MASVPEAKAFQIFLGWSHSEGNLDSRMFTAMKVVRVSAPQGRNQVVFALQKYAPGRDRSQGNIVEVTVNVAIENDLSDVSESVIRRLAVPAAKQALREAAEALDRNPLGSPY